MAFIKLMIEESKRLRTRFVPCLLAPSCHRRTSCLVASWPYMHACMQGGLVHVHGGHEELPGSAAGCACAMRLHPCLPDQLCPGEKAHVCTTGTPMHATNHRHAACMQGQTHRWAIAWTYLPAAAFKADAAALEGNPCKQASTCSSENGRVPSPAD